MQTIKFSQMMAGGDLTQGDITAGLLGGANATFTNPWTFLASGSTAARPAPTSAIFFRMRFNTDTSFYEYYDPNTAQWVEFSGSGTGTVNPGSTNDIAFYPANGTVLSPITAAANAVLVTNGSMVPSLSTTLPTGLSIPGATITSSTAALTAGQVAATPVNPTDIANKAYVDAHTGSGVTSIIGTTNQVIASSPTGTVTLSLPQDIALGSSPTFSALTLSSSTNHAVMIGQASSALHSVLLGAGQLLIGTTAADPVAATLTAGTGINITNASGSITIANTGGSGTVNSGLINQVAWYAASGTAVSGLATAASSVLVTSAGSVPSLSTTLPTGLAMQTPASINLTNGTALPVPGGLTATGTPSSTTFLRGDGTWSAPAGSGTVNTGTINDLAFYASSTNAVSPLATANSGVLVTSAGGVPSISTTLPNGLAMGTPASLTLTNATGLPVPGGLSTTGSPSSTTFLNGAGAWAVPGTGTAFTTIVQQVFNATGTYTPTTGMVYCRIQCIGGGGAGGGSATVSSTASAGGGGGSGGFSYGWFTAATIGASQSVTIGTGGTGVSAGTGNSGTATSVGALISANGGGGAQATGALTITTYAQAGQGASTPAGSFQKYVGNSGDYGLVLFPNSVVGGNGANSFISGGPAPTATTSGSVQGQAGGANTGCGGGGSAASGTASALAGGAGGSGVVIITEYCT